MIRLTKICHLESESPSMNFVMKVDKIGLNGFIHGFIIRVF